MKMCVFEKEAREMRRGQPPIETRLAVAFCAIQKNGHCDYFALMYLVFPEDIYPNAYRGASKGGPFGCVRAFGSALTRYGYCRIGHEVFFKENQK